MGDREHPLTIVIMSRAGDAHASAVREVVADRGHRCLLLDAGHLGSDHQLELRPGGRSALVADGVRVAAEDIDAIWFRRWMREEDISAAVTDPDVRRLALSAGRRAYAGLCAHAVNACFLSHPAHIEAAENKLLQLDAALAAGLRIPETVVTNNAVAVRAAIAGQAPEPVIAKAFGSSRSGFSVVAIGPQTRVGDDELSFCASIYQETVPGERHLRVCVVADHVVAVELDCPALDWRFEPSLSARRVLLDASTTAALESVLQQLRLRMGIFDLKVADDGTPVFLEVNPQGQFLFLEDFCDGLDLAATVADVLVDDARRARHGRLALRR